MHVVSTKIPGHLRAAERERLKIRLLWFLKLELKRRSEELWKVAMVIAATPHGIDVMGATLALPGQLVFPVKFKSEGGAKFHWRDAYPEPFFVHKYEEHEGIPIVRITPNVKDGKPCCNA